MNTPDDMIRATWEELADTGLLWEVNKLLLSRGWAILADIDDNNPDVYPVKLTEE